MPLQRIVVDFGSDESFQSTCNKITEHYGIVLPESSIQTITEKHAYNMLSTDYIDHEMRDIVAKILITETDGTMIPIVEIEVSGPLQDKRKLRRVCWKEAKLCFSRENNSLKRIFAARLGSVDDAGDALYETALRLGFVEETRVHGIGDGAPWIAEQFDRVFGGQGYYLIDFYHLSEYLSAAAEYCLPEDPIAWRHARQGDMKENHYSRVLHELERYICREGIKDKDHSVMKCYRYMNNRRSFFDYAGAIEKGLPIGSGEIESSHKSVIQKRLKIPGAWWKTENARAMLALRVVRANGDWEKYWNQQELRVA